LLKNLLFHQTSVRFDEKPFLYGALVFFERAFDLVHMITLSIRHSSNYSILAGRRITENYIWNAGDYFTDAELVHRLIPRVRRFTASQRCARTATKRRKE